jgi:hypothetical protein
MHFDNLKSGVTAGFAATVVLSLLMIAKAMMGLMPELNPIKDIVTVGDTVTGLQLPLAAGWVGHFLIGSILSGAIYTLIEPSLPGPAVVKGLIFAVIAWLAMIIVFMPLAGQGFFAMALGLPAVVATLVLHLVYGAVLGVVYASQLGGAAVADVRPN